jgi:hypothetical protein
MGIGFQKKGSNRAKHFELCFYLGAHPLKNLYFSSLSLLLFLFLFLKRFSDQQNYYGIYQARLVESVPYTEPRPDQAELRKEWATVLSCTLVSGLGLLDE